MKDQPDQPVNPVRKAIQVPKVPLGRRVLPELPDQLVPLDRLAQSGPQDQKAIQAPRQNPNSKTLGMGPPQLAASSIFNVIPIMPTPAR